MPICTIESIQSHLDELRKRVASTQEELSKTTSTNTQAKKTKISKLSKRIAQIELRLRLAKKEELRAKKALDKLSALQTIARTKLGTDHLKTSEFAALPPNDRLTHTEIRIEGSSDPSHQLNSLKRLHRFSGNVEVSHPISSSLSLRSPTTLARSLDEALVKNGIELTTSPSGNYL